MRNFGKHSIDIVFETIEAFEHELSTRAVHPAPDQFLVVPIASVHQYIRCVEILQRYASKGRNLIFRGHRDEVWELVPAVMRHPVFGKGPTSDEVDVYETELLDSFLELARPFFQTPPRIDRQRWELLALAQHHRLPTRLLDWTYRAGTALFFAIEDVDSSVRAPVVSPDSCVFAIFTPDALKTRSASHDHDKINAVYLFNPPHISPRITMQQGCFTAHPSHYMVREYHWINSEPRVVFTFLDQHREHLREGLRAIGINRAALFPDLDGICGHLRDSIVPSRIPGHH